ncbi:MAG TPA: hypothetical protein VMZ53_16320 [Kofleriaceae bacterium]|nr:hypothetical protein [Kofleriaceae bacterium]
MRGSLLLALALVAAVGCSKDKKGPSSKDGVIDAWKKGGLEPSAFTEAKTDIGKNCSAGTVNKVDVLLCAFGSEKEAKDAEEKGLQWVGDTTGASQAQGEMLIVAADRRKADPSGRTINQLLTLPAK